VRGGVVGFIKDRRCRTVLHTTSSAINVTDILGGRVIAKEDAIVGMLVKLGRAMTIAARRDERAKDTEVGEVWNFASPSLIGCNIDGRMPEAVLQMYCVKKCSTPVLGRKSSCIKKRSNHNSKGAIEAFNLAILVGCVIAGRFHAVMGSKNNLAKRSRGPEFASLIHAKGTVTLSEAMTGEELSKEGCGRGFTGSQKNPGVACKGISNDEIRTVAIV
jgi:hypothetical protein